MITEATFIDEFTIPSRQLMTPTDFALSNVVTFFNGGGENGVVIIPTPTSINIISGNVKKLGLAYGLKIVIVSVELNSKVVGTGSSDEVTGDYSIDIYPWVDEVIVMAEPNYGLPFVASSVVALDQLIHPSVFNGNIYKVVGAGTLGLSEPNWSDTGVISSGSVNLQASPLYRPLANGFLKPIITPV